MKVYHFWSSLHALLLLSHPQLKSTEKQSILIAWCLDKSSATCKHTRQMLCGWHMKLCTICSDGFQPAEKNSELLSSRQKSQKWACSLCQAKANNLSPYPTKQRLMHCSLLHWSSELQNSLHSTEIGITLSCIKNAWLLIVSEKQEGSPSSHLSL